ncbi:FliM/FliN family flagellar motor switch protein [Altererythrobacter sp. Z27]|uniref:FliM/FliN family flagellar motor switch protein n=1 Tax=Altererythrobacter sp. Z27 TaxID=3461147 RepID=UPI004043C362
MNKKNQTEAKEADVPSTNWAQLVDHVEVVCEVILGTGIISIGRLGQVTAGDIITLDRTPADPVDIRLNGQTIARGEIVTVNDRFAVRVTEIGSNEPEA